MYIDNIYHTDYPFDRKVGEWECLGHLMRTLDHPLSIWFKCSECGYEYYWLFSGFPKECPGCRARMDRRSEMVDALDADMRKEVE